MSTATQIALVIVLAIGWTLGLPRFAPRIGVAGASCKPSDFEPSAMRGYQAEGDWLVYRNAKNGLSFRYPSFLRAVDVDPVKLGMVQSEDKAPDVVDLRAQGSIIMRFICGRGEQTPEMAAKEAHWLRKQAASEGRESYLASMQIDGHDAILAAVRGGGAGSCLWGVTILQPRRCSIFPMGGSDDSSAPLHDGHFPSLSIIETVHFEPVRSKR
jgi:hypothetical protein